MDTGDIGDGRDAGRVVIRGRRARRRRAIGAATIAMLVVGAAVAVPAWTFGRDRPTRSHAATEAPSPSVASPSLEPSESATRALGLSKAEVQAWLDDLPVLPDVPKITGDASPVLDIVHRRGSTGAEAWKATARLVATGKILATGDPHGEALDVSGDRIAVAMEQGVGARRDRLVSVMVFTADTGTLLKSIAGLELGTYVRGWLDGRVVLDVYTDGNREDRVLIWDPEKTTEPLIEVADGHVVDVAEAGHGVLIEELGGACTRVWQIVKEPEPRIEDCDARFAAISDNGELALIAPKSGDRPAVLNLSTRAQIDVQVPWRWVGTTRWSSDDRLVMRILTASDEDSPVVVCETDTGSCSRGPVVPSP